MISKDDVKKLANLARIGATEEELLKIQGELGSIIEYVGQIQNANVSGAESEVPELINVLREDKDPNVSGFYSEDLINRAPSSHNKYIKVKKILS